MLGKNYADVPIPVCFTTIRQMTIFVLLISIDFFQIFN